MTEALATLIRGDFRLAERPLPPLAVWLKEVRDRRRFSQPELAAASGLSKGYISQLENGYDPRTGKEIRPTPKVLQLLAAGLAEGHEDEAKAYYRELMELAGYIEAGEDEPPLPVDGEVGTTLDAIIRGVRQTPDLSEDDKDFIARLIERSRRIMRDEPDPEQ